MITYSIDSLVITHDGDLKVTGDESRLWTSLDSSFLREYKDEVIDPARFTSSSTPEDDCYAQNYARLFGFRRVHLGTLASAGFLNKRYDVTFGFPINKIINDSSVVCNSELLFAALYQSKNVGIRDLFKPREQFTAGDELVVPRLDLTKADLVLVYSFDAKYEIESNENFAHLRLAVMTDFRSELIKLTD